MSQSRIILPTSAQPPGPDDGVEPMPGAARAELYAIYAELDHAITAAGPVCVVSGRCCRFAEYGHTLFVSAPEFSALLAGAPAPVRPLDDGATCPWQDDHGRCTARAARPLGCRVYFCELSYRERAHELSEQFLRRLRRLAEDHGLPWDYAPLHVHLRRAAAAGRFVAIPHGPEPEHILGPAVRSGPVPTVHFALDTTPW